MITLGLCLKVLSIVTCLHFLPTDGNLQIPTLNAEIIEAYNQTSLKFECRAFTHPKGSLHFLVNNKSVDVMRFANNKCYNKSRECSNESCYCSYKDYSFIWYHNVNEYSIHSTFGVVIKIATAKHAEVIMITISGIYDTTAFKVREILYEEVRPPKEDDVEETTTMSPESYMVEKQRDVVFGMCLMLVPGLTALVCLIYKTVKDGSHKGLSMICLIGFIIIYLVMYILITALDMNNDAKTGLTVFCCLMGIPLIAIPVIWTERPNCISCELNRQRVKREGLNTWHCSACLHSSNDADLSVKRRQSQESNRIDEEVPMMTNDQTTGADTSSFNITTGSMVVPKAHLGKNSD